MPGYRFYSISKQFGGQKDKDEVHVTNNQWKQSNANPLVENDIEKLSYLVNIIKMSNDQNLKKEHFLMKTLKETSNIIKETKVEEKIEFEHMCSFDSLDQYHQAILFAKLDSGLLHERIVASNDEIIEGIELYYYMIYCPKNRMKLYFFLLGLILHHTPATIIQAIANTLRSDMVNSMEELNLINNVYFTIEELYQIEIGRIFIGIKDSSEMMKMIEGKVPFLDKYEEEIRKCINKFNCNEMRHIIESLGKV